MQNIAKRTPKVTWTVWRLYWTLTWFPFTAPRKSTLTLSKLDLLACGSFYLLAKPLYRFATQTPPGGGFRHLKPPVVSPSFFIIYRANGYTHRGIAELNWSILVSRFVKRSCVSSLVPLMAGKWPLLVSPPRGSPAYYLRSSITSAHTQSTFLW